MKPKDIKHQLNQLDGCVQAREFDTAGSMARAQIMLARDLNYLDDGKLVGLKANIPEVERMFKALISSLENKHSAP